MKVAIGFHIQDGPWGGGNRFAQSLAQALQDAGHQVCFDLVDRDIDIILLTDPRPRSPSVSFSAGAILLYLTFKNPKALVVHRINECDERKNTKTMNAALVRANWCADHTVFVGSWLIDLPVWQKNLRTPHSVILNGTDPEIFNPDGFTLWNEQEPLRLVTHHWGGNWMKGFDIYERLDQMLTEPKWQGRIDFSYIGNLPKGFKFRNATHVPPMNGLELAAKIKTHHAYITASICEPGGNHQNEAGACGLPLLYRRSGCLPEYCEGFGIAFDESDFENALEQLLNDYTHHAACMSAWPHWSMRTCADYLALFGKLLHSREALLDQRNLWQKPWLILRNQIPL